MAYMNKYQSDDYRREELIRIIEHSVEKLTLAELEALYYSEPVTQTAEDWYREYFHEAYQLWIEHQ